MITIFQVINGLRALPLLGNFVGINFLYLYTVAPRSVWRFTPLFLVTFENLREFSAMFGSRQMKTFGTWTCDLLEGAPNCAKDIYS